MRVGVLALQGDVPEHRRALERVLPARSVCAVARPKDLDPVDAVVLPGGESTTIGALLEKTGLWKALSERIHDGLPVLATCAGLILLSRELEPSPSGQDPPTFGALDVRVRRNDYGSQSESFEGDVKVAGVAGRAFPGVFIRAPRITRIGKSVKAIAHRGEEVVGVRRGPLVGLTFHPELSEDPRLHAWFLRSVVERAR